MRSVLTLIALMLSILPHSAWSVDSCGQLLATGEATIRPGDKYVHVVRVGDQAWGTSAYDFWQLLKKLKNTTDSIQKNWIPQGNGQLYTYFNGANTFNNGSPHFAVTFKLKKDFSFLKADHIKSFWSEWISQKKNKSRPNRFTKEHIASLKQSELPYHSEFYTDHALAGFALRMKYGDRKIPYSNYEFTIVNAEAIQTIEVQPVDIDKLNPDEIPEDFRATRKVFQLKDNE